MAAAAAKLKNTFLSITRPPLRAFAPNLIQTLRIRSLDNFNPEKENLYPTKSNTAAAAILKITITRPLLHIFALKLKEGLKIGSCRKVYRQNSHSAKNPTWRRPRFCNQLNGNNSVIFEWIHTKFDKDTENEAPELVSMTKLISHKIQDGDECHTVNYIFGHNWANIADIYTEFDTCAEKGLPKPVVLSKYA